MNNASETARHQHPGRDRDGAAVERAIREAGGHELFDEAWYSARYAAEGCSGTGWLDDYLSRGHAAGREPHWLFDSSWYFAQFPDAGRSVGALVHYLAHGAAAGASPHPLFDTPHVLAQLRLVREGGEDAAAAYLRHRPRGDVDPHPLFDASFYLDQHPDVAAAGVDPLRHYLASGVAQGCDPHPLFDSAWYARTYAAELGGTNPLVHYVTVGAVMGLDPHPLFDSAWYVARCGDPAARLNALLHYLRHGAADPHPLFDRAWYAARMPESAALAGTDPLIHFALHGARTLDPHPLFDTRQYLLANPDVHAAGHVPLVHYMSAGAAELRDPHGVFKSRFYLAEAEAAYLDDAGLDDACRDDAGLQRARSNPLVHYVTEGAALGLSANPWFDPAWYLRQNGDVADAGLEPLAHYARNGLRERRDPHPRFSLAHYLLHAPDVAEAGRDPLVHYTDSGEAEHREIRPPDRWVDECAVTAIPWEVRRVPPPLAGREVCFFMTYSPTGGVFPHVVGHMRAYKDAGFTLVMLMATEGLAGPISPEAEALCDGVLVRSNHGLDFATWACGLTVFADVWAADLLLLVNDSLYGPVSEPALASVLRRVRDSTADVVWLTDSRQVRHHAQSFFTAITATGLLAEGVHSFWQSVRSLRVKQQVIDRYELTALDHMEANGVKVEVLFPTLPEHANHNPTLALWGDLLDRGFPFLKVQLLRDELDVADPAGWQDRLAGNPALRNQIELHLATGHVRTTLGSPRVRPVPAPRRRLMRPAGLWTYYGATAAIRPTDETDLALEVPFRGAGATPALWTHPVAVIAHVFYPELLAHLMELIANIPVRADLFVSTDTEAKRDGIALALAEYGPGTVEIRVFPNRGRDVAPAFVGFADVFDRYELFLHVHTKKSPHEGRFAPWRDYLLHNLLGSREVVSSILDLFAATDVGVVFAQHFPEVRTLLNFGFDYDLARGLLARAGIDLGRDLVLDFPSSSFLWGRSAAMRGLLGLGLSFDDFPEEAGQVDGTLAHAVERSLLFFAEAAGFRWAKVAHAGSGVGADTLVPVERGGDLPACLTRVHHWLLGNHVPPLEDAGTVTEVAPILVRPDRAERPRLTLLLPTLRPDKVFGGLATALRIFEALARELGERFDYRIVSTSEPVDLDSARSLPAYRVCGMDAPADGQPRTIVDATDTDGGALTVRPNDVFVATAWWTAVSAFRFQAAQRRHHAAERPVVYLIQDHEPDFYGWSSRSGLARKTYRTGTPVLPLINSEELANFMAGTYAEEGGMHDGFVIPFTINPAIERSLRRLPKERIVLVYGRPGTPRNCFEVLWQSLLAWQARNPVEAKSWRIVSAGEWFDTARLPRVANLEVTGKLGLSDYGELLSRAAVGVSLMMSPHPSYPPLEMACAGVRTVTNAYAGKDLSRRSANILSVADVTVEDVAAALELAVAAALPTIGTVVEPAPVGDVPCDLPRYDPATVAARIAGMVGIAVPSTVEPNAPGPKAGPKAGLVVDPSTARPARRPGLAPVRPGSR